jgi:hypothetical protein
VMAAVAAVTAAAVAAGCSGGSGSSVGRHMQCFFLPNIGLLEFILLPI